MMEQKYFEEIKAREQAATPGPWRKKLEKNATLGRYVWHFYNQNGKFAMDEADSDFICNSRTDIPALIAEVERLTEENEQNASYVDICEGICDRYEENFKALLDKAKALQSENATLKKALELMAKDFYDASDDEVHSGPDGLANDYIQFATHETHEGSEADHATNN